MVKRIYVAQKENLSKGDWCKLVKKDFEDIDIVMIDNDIVNMTKYKEQKTMHVSPNGN